MERKKKTLVKLEFVAHADWSLSARKRWMAQARYADGQYVADEARLWNGASKLFASNGLLGVDFPIGLPMAYAEAMGVNDFLRWLPAVPDSFFAVAESAETISLARPFYPMRPGGTSQQQLVNRLGVDGMNDLKRQCELATVLRNSAESMFWTLGAKQVGKAMLTGWRELLQPNLDRLAVWPFDGTFADLVIQQRPIIAESYPGEFYHHLNLPLNGSKRSQTVRQGCAEPLLTWAAANQVIVTDALRQQIKDGFGKSKDGEDPFDAVVGLFGMLNVIVGNRDAMPSIPERIHKIEGWIFGQTALPK